MGDDEKKERGGGSLFAEVNKLRHGVEVDLDALEHAKLNDTVFGKLAKDKRFEYTTLGVISFNALFIGYDADFNARFPDEKPDGLYDSGMPLQFPILENFFAIYFTMEIVVRFLAYKHKIMACHDGWFVFDSALVTIMVFETWIAAFLATGGPLGNLSVLRLLRLLRITRMTKLMRLVPELMLIVKGMIAAVRAVACTFILLVAIVYVFAILFTTEFHQGGVDPDDIEDGTAPVFFGTMYKSMTYLFICGTILDDITACANAIRGSTKGASMLIAFLLYVLMSSFTLFNMLIGILCEVVEATAEGERVKNTEGAVKDAISNLFSRMDTDGNGVISREEFLSMRSDADVKSALKTMNVQERHFVAYADIIFKHQDEGPAEEEVDAGGEPVQEKDARPSTCSLTEQHLKEKIDFNRVLEIIMRLRPGNDVSAFEFGHFSHWVEKEQSNMKQQVDRLDSMMWEIAKRKGVKLSQGSLPRAMTFRSSLGGTWATKTDSKTGRCSSISVNSEEMGRMDSKGSVKSVRSVDDVEGSDLRFTASASLKSDPREQPPTSGALDSSQLEKASRQAILAEIQRRMKLEGRGWLTASQED